MSILKRIFGILGLILGILVNLFIFNYTVQSPFIAFILIGVIGEVFSLVSLKLGNEKTFIGIIGAILNLIPVAYLILLCISFG